MDEIPKNEKYQSYRKLIVSEYQNTNGRPADHGLFEAGDEGHDVYSIKRIILELAEIQRAIQDDDIDKETVFDQIHIVRNFIKHYEGEHMPTSLIEQTMDHVNHSIFNLPTYLERKRARMHRKMKEHEALKKERKAHKKKAKIKS